MRDDERGQGAKEERPVPAEGSAKVHGDKLEDLVPRVPAEGRGAVHEDGGTSGAARGGQAASPSDSVAEAPEEPRGHS